jgi:hypothetical protein
MEIDGKKPIRIKVGGKLSFANLSSELQTAVKKRLAQKDNVAAKGLAGELPGIKIDGREVTKDNIHEFEVKPKTGKPKSKPKSVKKYTRVELNELSFSELRDIGNKLNIKFRSKKEAIREILGVQ